jgi:hypothetical protein
MLALMAKKSGREELVDRLRATGLRRKVAESVADGLSRVRPGRKPPKKVRGVLQNLKAMTSELEDRATGGPARRSAAAKKAAATRKRNAAKRSTAAKKGARTRAKARS